MCKYLSVRLGCGFCIDGVRAEIRDQRGFTHAPFAADFHRLQLAAPNEPPHRFGMAIEPRRRRVDIEKVVHSQSMAQPRRV